MVESLSELFHSAAAKQFFVSTIIGLLAIVLNERIPRVFKPHIEREVQRLFKGENAFVRNNTLRIAFLSADFISSIGAMFVLLVSLLVELWKHVQWSPDVLALVLLIFAVIAVPLERWVLSLNWISKKEEAYDNSIGKILKNIIRLLSVILIVATTVLA